MYVFDINRENLFYSLRALLSLDRKNKSNAHKYVTEP